MPPSKHIVRVTLVVDKVEHAVEAEFEDRPGLLMMMKSLMRSAEQGFLELMKQRQEVKDVQSGPAPEKP